MNSSILSTITITSLVFTIVGSQLCPDCVHLIDRLNSYYSFDHNIFLMESSTVLDNWLKTSPLSANHCETLCSTTPQTIYTFENNSDSAGTEMIEQMTSKNTFIVVVIKSLIFEGPLLAKIKAIRHIDHNVKVGVFLVPNSISEDVIRLVDVFFHWAWSVGIVNIFSALCVNIGYNEMSFNAFKYDPFREFDWIDVTIGSPQDYFAATLPNYCEEPLIFLTLPDHEMSIIESHFWNTIIRAFNATVSQIYMTNAEYHETEQAQADFMLNEHFMERLYKVYPYRQTGLVLIVPHSQPYSDFIVYLQNRSWTILMVFATVVIVTAALLLTISSYLNKRKIRIFECGVDVMNLLLNENSGIRYQNLRLADIFVTVPLTFTGLIVMNGIVSIFQSYITSPIYQPQINSIEHLYTSSIPILIDEMTWKDRFLEIMEDMTDYGGWKERLHKASKDELSDVMKTFNNSVAFLFNDYETNAFFQLQNRLGMKTYHLLRKTGLPTYLRTFDSSSDFAFIENINEIIHRLNAAGLIDKWVSDNTRNSIEDILRSSLIRKRNSNELAASESTIPIIVWCGWAASVVAFICEVIWKKATST